MKNSPITDPITEMGVAHAFKLFYILYNFQIQYFQMIDYICLHSLSSLNYLRKIGIGMWYLTLITVRKNEFEINYEL